MWRDLQAQDDVFKLHRSGYIAAGISFSAHVGHFFPVLRVRLLVIQCGDGGAGKNIQFVVLLQRLELNFQQIAADFSDNQTQRAGSRGRRYIGNGEKGSETVTANAFPSYRGVILARAASFRLGSSGS